MDQSRQAPVIPLALALSILVSRVQLKSLELFQQLYSTLSATVEASSASFGHCSRLSARGCWHRCFAMGWPAVLSLSFQCAALRLWRNQRLKLSS